MSYISSLNLLNTDSPAPINEEAFQEELALWANAQFSFDTIPGSALEGNESKKDESLFKTLSKLTQLVQPIQSSTALPQPIQSAQYQHHTLSQPYYNIPSTTTNINLPRIAPALGSTSGIQVLDATTNQTASTNNKKRSVSEKPADDSELTPDDDKRRRNTAASARFRMKKKLREQALEKTTKNMSVNVERLENRVKELEMEAKWLRALVVEKDPKLLSNDSESLVS